MAELPLLDAIPRFKANEDRVDKFTNGTDTETWTTSGSVAVPSIRKFLKDKDDQVNAAVTGILDDVTTARDITVAAKDTALAAVTGFIAAKPTIAAAMLDDPALDPDYYEVTYYDTAYQPGSGALWRKADLNDNFTKILLHMDGADGATAIVDGNAGGSAHAWSASGNAQIDTANSKFGGTSLLCDGSGDYVSTPDHANFTLGSGDFTIELWFKLNGGDGTAINIAGQTDAGFTAAGSAWRLVRNAANKMEFRLSDGAAFTSIVGTTSLSTVSNPGWHHLTVVRNGTTLKMYLDGVVEASGTFAGAVNDSAAAMNVGSSGGNSLGMNGWIDEFRLSVGVARHTTNFTLPSAPYASLPSGAAFQNANGTWYVNDSPWLRPEQFGRIGVNAAGDTAAWNALIATANFRGGNIKVALGADQYLLNGTGNYDDSQTFKGIDSIWVRIAEECEIRQKVALTHTLKFKNCLDVRITGGRLIGFAQTQIDAGQPLTETDLNSSSASNISGMLFDDCKNVEIVRLKTQNVFGRDILALGCELLRVRECKLIGVGWTYNDPIRDSHQGNGEDAAIYAIPTDFSLTGTAWKQVVEVCNCHIEGHSFAIRTILNKRLKVHGNYFGPTPGQYHIYGTDDDGVSMIGNHFYRSRIVAVKLQHENLAGTIYGPLWVTGKAYVVGDVVRNSLILWECITAHTSGGAFDSSKWKQHSRFIRRGAVFANNIVENCGGGLAYIAPFIVEVNGRNIWSEGAEFIGNTFVNCTSDIIRLERCINVKVTGNKVDGGTYGILGRYVSGDISNNDFREIVQNAISLSLAWTTNISENKFWDCGYAGANDAERAAVVIGTLTGTDPPLFGPNPRVFFRNNGFIYTGGVGSKYLAMPSDCPGAYLVMDVDTRNVWEIEGTFGTPTTKKFRIDGNVAYQFRNHFIANGYNNTAQNEMAYTLEYSTDNYLEAASTLSGVRDVLGTFIARLAQQRIVKKN